MNTVQALDYAIGIIDRRICAPECAHGNCERGREAVEQLQKLRAADEPDTPETAAAKFKAARSLLDRFEYP